MQKLNRDIGSSFYTLQGNDKELLALAETKTEFKFNFSYYYSGRNAILAILKKITQNQSINVIWLPEYYCDTVVNLVCNNFENVKYYPINPFEFETEPNIYAFTKQNDIVVLNNFWGLSSFNYQTNHSEKPIIIEDHSHGWLSKQCLQSKADYCICALRKTYPIPLGAIAWTPISGENINFYENAEDSPILNALEQFWSSMALKRQFIKENNLDVKGNYLLALNEGESLLSESNNYIKPSTEFIDLMNKHIHLNPNNIKLKHLNYIFKHIVKSENFKIITRQEFTPFGLLLLFKDEKLFQSFKTYLIANQIYPAHLWPHNKLDSQWKYLFNIHVDFRYDIEDMRYLVEKINVWSKNNV